MTAIRACLFDVYGTLLDVHSAVARAGERLGPTAQGFSVLWRTKQLEYSWVRSLMGRYADFWQLTEDALDYALAVHGQSDTALRAELLEAYRRLAPFPEVEIVLKALRARGMKLAAFSNGSPAMLQRSLAGAGLEGLVDECISVHPLATYKPAPNVYDHALRQMGLRAEEI